MAAERKQTCLTAAYKSPDNEAFTVTNPIDARPSVSIPDKTTYLQALRKAVTEIQQQINMELTTRMEEDKNRGPATGQTGKLSADEDKEEENYGEEIQEED